MDHFRKADISVLIRERIGDDALIERSPAVRKGEEPTPEAHQVLLERNYNSSWMLRVLGKFMGPSDLR
jgi:hypothetical protein